MAVATALTVIKTAAALLNDRTGVFWADDNGNPYDGLIPFLQEAYRDLSNDLYLNGLPVIHKTAIILAFPALATTLTLSSSPALPSDIITPVKMWERTAGSTFEDFQEMIPKSWEPNLEQDEDLTYWMWQGQVINFIGATEAKDLRLDYDAGLPLPTADGDTIGFIDGEFFLAPKTAAYAAESIDRISFAEVKHAQAESKLSKIVRANVKSQQNLPVRRRPYRRASNIIIGR